MMDLVEIKQKLIKVEADLNTNPIVLFAQVETPHGVLNLSITDRFKRKCRKGGVWKSNSMLTALKNAAYGYNERAPRSRGGTDGIFSVDRNFKPYNSMMKKLFSQFIDKPDPLVSILVDFLGSKVDDWIPVRLVSHHLRLLGIISSTNTLKNLALVDYDNEK